MRWRFTDRITRFDAWAAIEGRKTVSLEEYDLLEPLGRKGVLPEALVIESCAHLARWLVMASSGFGQTCLVTSIDRFEFRREATVGCALKMAIRVADRNATGVRLACEVADGGEALGAGALGVSLESLAGMASAADMLALWRELYAKA